MLQRENNEIAQVKGYAESSSSFRKAGKMQVCWKTALNLGDVYEILLFAAVTVL